jgi:hypothetical protein
VDDDHGVPDRAATGFRDPDPVAFRAAGGLHHDVDVVGTQGADADGHGRPLPLEYREVAV